MAIADRGFASMDPVKRAAICSRGGKRAHAMGKGHEWDSEEAQKAGRKGGLASAKKRAAKLAAAQ